MSYLIAKLCKMAKSKPQVMHQPVSSSNSEHFSYTLISMLGTLPKEKKAVWHNMVPTLVSLKVMLQGSDHII